jgi:hypothetical protein
LLFILVIFPQRSRREVKKKFNKEEKSNPNKVTFMLRKRLAWDAEKFKDFPGAKDMDRSLRGITPGISSNASDSMPMAFERGSEPPTPSRASTPVAFPVQSPIQQAPEPIIVEQNKQEEEVEEEEEVRSQTPENTLRPTAQGTTAMEKLQTTLKVSMSSSTIKRSGMFKVNTKMAKKRKTTMTSITAADLEDKVSNAMESSDPIEKTVETKNAPETSQPVPSAQPTSVQDQIPIATITPPITEPSSIATTPTSLKEKSSMVSSGFVPASSKPTQTLPPAPTSPSKEISAPSVLNTAIMTEISTAPAIVTAGVKKAGIKSMFKPKARAKKT